MKYSEKKAMYARIEKHGEHLKTIFSMKGNTDPIKLCKALRIIERKLNTINEEECNTGDMQTDKACNLMDKAKNILFPDDEIKLENLELYKAVVLNGDPRGYALKIESDYVRDNDIIVHRDCGGYGIIAPDLTNN